MTSPGAHGPPLARQYSGCVVKLPVREPAREMRAAELQSSLSTFRCGWQDLCIGVCCIAIRMRNPAVGGVNSLTSAISAVGRVEILYDPLVARNLSITWRIKLFRSSVTASFILGVLVP